MPTRSPSNLVAPGDPDRRSRPRRRPAVRAALSGWYWQVGRPGGAPVEIRSSSNRSSAGSCRDSRRRTRRAFGQIRRGYGQAPDDRELRMVERDIDVGEDGRFIIRVAGPADEIADAVHALRASRCSSPSRCSDWRSGFTTLLQIRFGLQPARQPAQRAWRDPARRGRTDPGRISAGHRAAGAANSTSCSTPTARSSSAPARRSATSPMR